MTFRKIVTFENRRARFVECECDQCGKIYTKRYQHTYCDSEKLTFCCNKCRIESSKKSGKINCKIEEACIKKFGVTSPAKSKEVRQKMIATCQERYGVDNSFQSEEKKRKIRKTLQEKYGVEHPMLSDVIKEKVRATCMKRYGEDHQWKSKLVRDKCKKTSREKYGVDYPMQSETIKENFRKQFLIKHGVTNPSKLADVKEKKKKTCLKHYGVEYPLQSMIIKSKIDWNAITQKSHYTMKKNGSYQQSKIEDRFYEFLCENFGHDKILRQVRAHKWNIDFYITSIDTYIQFDGVYWHGLDRSVEVIKEFKNLRDRIIYKTWIRDKEQNKWFKQNKMKLIRITDKDFINSQSDRLINRLVNKEEAEKE